MARFVGMKTMQMKADESVLTKLRQAYADAKARLGKQVCWPNGPVCPHCQNTGEKRISKLEAHQPERRSWGRGVLVLRCLPPQFTVTVGTIMSARTFRYRNG